jgi:hypothetical protein
LSVSEGEITNWRCSSEIPSSSISLFFRPQEAGTGETWKDGTHLTTEMRDNVAVLVMTAVLVLVVKLIEVMTAVLVDTLTEVLVVVPVAVLMDVLVLVDVVVYVLKKGLLW